MKSNNILKTKKDAKTRRAGFCLFFYVFQQCKALRHLLREPVTKRRTAKIRNDSLLERPGTSIRSSFRNMTIKNRNSLSGFDKKHKPGNL